MRKLVLFSFLLSLTSFLLISCGGGDDDGRRFGDYVVGTWQRGWNEGDVVIEGDSTFRPEDQALDLLVFYDDGSYNGMVRSGSFSSYDFVGYILYEGTYRCDNNNLKLEFKDEGGTKRTILAQILMFSEEALQVRYENEKPAVTITMKLKKKTDQNQSSSTSDS